MKQELSSTQSHVCDRKMLHTQITICDKNDEGVRQLIIHVVNIATPQIIVFPAEF